MDTNEREGLENRLLKNQIKVLVATVALGMGFDKPDLGFVIHYTANRDSMCRGPDRLARASQGR